MKARLIFANLIVILYCCTVSAASLTPTESHIRDNVVRNKNAQLVLLEKLVNINSGTSNMTGVTRVGKVVEQSFKRLGFKTNWVAEPRAMKRAATLVAVHKGNSTKRILMIGHLDTVFQRDSDFQRFELKKNTAKGPGVLDDKGGIVVILYALEALKAAHVLSNANITVVLTGDEEASGKPASISRKPLIEAAKQSDIALDFEPSLTQDTASVGRRGISNWQIVTHGHEAHSSVIHSQEVGAGAIYELARILNQFYSDFKDEKNLSVSPGRIVAGNRVTDDKSQFNGSAAGKENVVAKIAIARGDVRYISSVQKDQFKHAAGNIVAQHLPGTSAEITFEDGIPAMPPTANNRQLLSQYHEVSMDLGYGKVSELDAGLRGAGDISYVAEIVPANLVGLGPEGYGMHAKGETVELASLVRQTQRVAVLLYRLMQK